MSGAIKLEQTREEYLARMAKNLKRWRLAADLTTDQVGAAIGVTGASIRNWESGSTTPNTFDFEKLRLFYKRLSAERRAAAKKSQALADEEAEAVERQVVAEDSAP